MSAPRVSSHNSRRVERDVTRRSGTADNTTMGDDDAASKFIVVKYGANKEAVFNTWCTGRTLLDHIRKKCLCGIHTGGSDILDLCDMDGNVCHLTSHLPDYADTFTASRRTYILIRAKRTNASDKSPVQYNFLLDGVDVLHPDLADKIREVQFNSSGVKSGASRSRINNGKTHWATMRSYTRSHVLSKSRDGRKTNSRDSRS